MRLLVKLIHNLLIICFFISCSQLTSRKTTDDYVTSSLTDEENKTDESGTLANSKAKKEKTIHEIIDSQSMCQDCIVGGSIPHEEEYGGEHRQLFYLYGAEELKLTNYYFDIPVAYNNQVKKWIKYFSEGRGRELFKRYASRASVYAPYASGILKEEGLPRDIIYLAMAESGFLNNAKSHAKAVGPWQFMSFTGKKFGLDINWYVDERRDPFKASRSAAAYLKMLYNMFGSWELAFAGYNAGEGKVSRAIKMYRTNNFWELQKMRYLKSETKNYVPKIMALAIIGNNLSVFGFGDLTFQKPLSFETISVPGNLDIYLLAETLGVDAETIYQLNPELLRWQTPPYLTSYDLKVPGHDQVIKWENINKEGRVADLTSNDFMVYEVNKHESLRDVAIKFRLPEEILENLNDLDSGTKLAPHSVLKLPFRNDQSIRHEMYADLYESKKSSKRQKRGYYRTLKLASKKGKFIKKPSNYYIVKKGDTLWHVSQRTGVSINTIIRTNYSLLSKGVIRPGDKIYFK